MVLANRVCGKKAGERGDGTELVCRLPLDHVGPCEKRKEPALLAVEASRRQLTDAEYDAAVKNTEARGKRTFATAARFDRDRSELVLTLGSGDELRIPAASLRLRATEQDLEKVTVTPLGDLFFPTLEEGFSVEAVVHAEERRTGTPDWSKRPAAVETERSVVERAERVLNVESAALKNVLPDVAKELAGQLPGLPDTEVRAKVAAAFNARGVPALVTDVKVYRTPSGDLKRVILLGDWVRKEHTILMHTPAQDVHWDCNGAWCGQDTAAFPSFKTTLNPAAVTCRECLARKEAEGTWAVAF